ncbi:hypothetical protein E2C01_050604 [Portunus trituberculatus]|uniref:Uncharacterized protein n=1 Tax=Portunus trituberculatus TaxID=210409 RepID=A0A5B7GGL9_PORTR|nr:hypothetical protein [Portunus trituberculatus]
MKKEEEPESEEIEKGEKQEEIIKRRSERWRRKGEMRSGDNIGGGCLLRRVSGASGSINLSRAGGERHSITTNSTIATTSTTEITICQEPYPEDAMLFLHVSFISVASSGSQSRQRYYAVQVSGSIDFPASTMSVVRGLVMASTLRCV